MQDFTSTARRDSSCYQQELSDATTRYSLGSGNTHNGLPAPHFAEFQRVFSAHSYWALVFEVYGIYISAVPRERLLNIIKVKPCFARAWSLGVVYLSINSGNSGDFGLTGGSDLQWHLCSMLRRCVSFCHIIIINNPRIKIAFVGGIAKSHVQPANKMYQITSQ